MRKAFVMLGLLVFAAAATTSAANACPMCKESIAATGSDPSSEDIQTGMNNARAYNTNILAMIGIMYGSLGVVGYFIYRGVKKNAIYLAQLRAQAPQPQG
jgi:hypothetical protein